MYKAAAPFPERQRGTARRMYISEGMVVSQRCFSMESVRASL